MFQTLNIINIMALIIVDENGIFKFKIKFI